MTYDFRVDRAHRDGVEADACHLSFHEPLDNVPFRVLQDTTEHKFVPCNRLCSREACFQGVSVVMSCKTLTSQSTAITQSAMRRRLSQTSALPCTAVVMMNGSTNFAIRPASQHNRAMIHRATEEAQLWNELQKREDAELLQRAGGEGASAVRATSHEWNAACL